MCLEPLKLLFVWGSQYSPISCLNIRPWGWIDSSDTVCGMPRKSVENLPTPVNATHLKREVSTLFVVPLSPPSSKIHASLPGFPSVPPVCSYFLIALVCAATAVVPAGRRLCASDPWPKWNVWFSTPVPMECSAVLGQHVKRWVQFQQLCSELSSKMQPVVASLVHVDHAWIAPFFFFFFLLV